MAGPAGYRDGVLFQHAIRGMLSAAADPASAGFRTDYALKTLRGVFEAKVGDKLDAVLRSPGVSEEAAHGGNVDRSS
ncbi:hypothetical protein HJB52_05905 [Rhizobium lentis]|uniref:hypothetical protein n=1 Tax=Rhizobium lentis TaxID=1138194 RepID=UPI001C83A3B3|nr:hypothetical protein [Rhizobium lentis]MBX5101417.1 hypothetical protein [Rhizobium lentis]